MTQPPYGPPPGQPPHGPPGQPPFGPPGQPPFGPPGQPPFGYQFPQPPRRKPLYQRTWFLVVAGFLFLGVVGSALGGESTPTAAGSAAPTSAVAEPSALAVPTPEPVAPATETEAPEPATPGIGQPAVDGKFTFVVNGVDCGTTQIGNQYLGKTAQGQFCIVDLTITNTGDRAQSFFGDNAELVNAQGQVFSADTEAAFYMDDSSSFYEEINPGNSLNSKVVFDVPAGTVPTAIELHDSAFSGGVTVALQ